MGGGARRDERCGLDYLVLATLRYFGVGSWLGIGWELGSGHALLRNRSGLKTVHCATALKIQDTPVVLSCRTAWRIQNDEPAPLPKGLADE
jgi:hypothetical protein